MEIQVNLVKQLIRTQFPIWRNLEIEQVKFSGHDNRTFHLGDKLVVRLPSAKHYEPQVEKEATWLPILRENLPIPITVPVAKGEPTSEYPYVWSVNKWLDGNTLTAENVHMPTFARDIASFLQSLWKIDSQGGPEAGTHNFYRGGDLMVYHAETEAAITALTGKIDAKKCSEIWQKALANKWTEKPVWIHGDMAQGNILVKDRKIAGVIDFGMLGIGDPACDLVLAWTFFDEVSRDIFIKHVNLPTDVWNRAKGWALWKALITWQNAADIKQVESAKKTIQVLIEA